MTPFIHSILEQNKDPLAVHDADAKPEVYEGNLNRELEVTVTPRNNTSRGAELTGVLVPSTVGGGALKFDGVSTIPKLRPGDTTGATFSGWDLRIVKLEMLDGGTFVYSLDGGSTWTAPRSFPFGATIPAGVNIWQQPFSAMADEPAVNFYILNTFDLADAEKILLIGSNGAADGETPIVAPLPPVQVSLPKHVPPPYQAVRFASAPTDAAGYIGQRAYTVEAE